MDEIAVIFAKLAGLYRVIKGRLDETDPPDTVQKLRAFDPAFVLGHFVQYANLRDKLKSLLPDLYSDLPNRGIPEGGNTFPAHI